MTGWLPWGRKELDTARAENRSVENQKKKHKGGRKEAKIKTIKIYCCGSKRQAGKILKMTFTTYVRHMSGTSASHSCVITQFPPRQFYRVFIHEYNAQFHAQKTHPSIPSFQKLCWDAWGGGRGAYNVDL